MKIQTFNIPKKHGRVETGPVQFNTDWPVVFIRGDSAAFFAAALKHVLESQTVAGMDYHALRSLQSTLADCVLGDYKKHLRLK